MQNAKLIYHIIFYATNRSPLADADRMPQLFNSIADGVRNTGNQMLEIGGDVDHVHLLVETQVQPIGELIDTIRLQMTRWMLEQQADIRENAGLERAVELSAGYFTVSFSMVDRVRRFIEDQSAHHQTVSFEEEYMALLDRHCVTS